MPTQLDVPDGSSNPRKRKALSAIPIAIVLLIAIIAAVAAWAHLFAAKPHVGATQGARHVTGQETPAEQSAYAGSTAASQ